MATVDVYDSTLSEIVVSPVPVPAAPGDDRIDSLVPRADPTPAARVVLDRLSRAGSLPIVRSFPPGAIVVFDHDLRYLSAGGLGLAGIGLSQDTLQGRTIFEIFPAAVAAAMAPSYRAALAGTESAVHVPFDGRLYLQRLGPLRDADGAIVAGMAFTQDVTDSRRLEESRRESEERLRQVIEHAPMGLAILRPDLGVTQVNPAFCRLTGHGEQQLLGMNAADLLVDPDGELDKVRMSRLLRGAAPSYAADVRFRTADGTLAWAALSVSLLRSADGSPAQFIVQVKDIGDRKRAEQSLLDKTRRLREAETVGRMGSWQLELATGMLSFSDGLLALYGIDPAAFRGDRNLTLEMTHPDDRGKLRAATDACIERGVPFELRCRSIRPGDGQLRWYEIRAERFQVDGRPDRVGGNVVDVTDLALAEAEVRSAYTFQQTVMDASPDLIFAYRMDSRSVVWSNRSLSGVLGFATPEADADPPSPMDAFVPQAAARELEEALHSAVEGVSDDTRHINLRLQDAAGSYRWFLLRATPLHRDDKGGVTELVGVLRDVTDAIVAEKLLKHSALHDSLTGLPNRALLIDRIDGALARSGRDHREISVLFCDLDGFKHINDTAGHKAGDAVLIETARRLQALLREGDTVARVGGDEFIILVEPWDRRAVDDHAGGRDEDETAARDRALAPHVAERIAHALREPVVVNGVEHVVTVSIGITYGTQSLRGDLRSVTADEMLQDADAAMYKAKSKGRSRFEVFEHSMRASLQERGRIESLLRQVLGTTTPVTADATAAPGGRLTAAYQPIFDSGTGELTGFEALARLVDADGASVPPDVFIPLAEECGPIRPLGIHVLDLACGQLTAWRHAQDMTGITIAVNVSALQAAEGTLGEDVQRALTTHGLEPSDIILELTETALLQAAHSTIVNLRALHATGIGIAIDDFGVGYASLRYLATLPISSLKIDKSFTAGLPHDVISSKIVMAVAGLAADLGLGCIVEGVETEHQRDALPPGVQLQGYLTGRPQPGGEIDVARLIARGALPV